MLKALEITFKIRYNCFSIQEQNLNVSAQIVMVGMISTVRFKIESYVEIDDININTILGWIQNPEEIICTGNCIHPTMSLQ